METKLETTVYSQAGQPVGKTTLQSGIFGVKWNADMVHQVVTSALSSRRHPVAHAKTRGEVSGGGKKPWRQKGTGRARHGSTRSPIWVGGGTTHGPRNDKNYDRKVNNKMAMKALLAVLSKKANEGEIICLNAIKFDAPKTKEAVGVIKALSAIKDFSALSRKKTNALCLAVPQKDVSIKRSFANIGNVEVVETRNLNVADILTKKFIAFVSPEESFKILEKRVK